MEEAKPDVTNYPRMADIREEWHWVRQVIAELIEENPDVDAIPEDIYADCRAGRAHLWVADDYVLITEFEISNYSGKRHLCIAYAKATSQGGKLAPDALDYMDKFAEANNCDGIIFGTRHQPLIDYLCSDVGFRVSTQILRRDRCTA